MSLIYIKACLEVQKKERLSANYSVLNKEAFMIPANEYV